MRSPRSRPFTTLSAPCLVRVKTRVRGHRGIGEKIGEERELVARLDMDDALIDALDGRRDGRDLDARRIVEQIGGEAGDLLRHGGREEQVLALAPAACR